MNKVPLVCVCVVLVAGLSGAEGPRVSDISEYLPGPIVEVGTLRTVQSVDREAAKRELAELHSWLMAEQVVAGVERPLAVQISTKELAEIELGVCEDCGEEPQALRVGITRQVHAELELDAVRWGAVERLPDGGRVWSAAVGSAGAFGLRLHFDNFRLPANSELYLFNEAGAVAGPYTKAGPLGTGEFWSHMVRGDVVYLQLRQYGPERAEKRRARLFSLVDVGHVAMGFGARGGAIATKEFCAFNAGCVVNAECGADPAVADAKYAVAHMLFVKRPFIYMCSGGLLNNTSDDQTPYFLTANHCISRDREAGTLEAYFQWWIDCGGECPTQWEDPVGVPRTLGSTVVATNNVGDYTLLRLSQPAPAESAFLGWSTADIANTDDAMLYRISHPAGAPQAFSSHQVDTSAGTCSSWPRGSWIYSRDMVGATEGGSSGSPVLNALGQVVGQLSGACGTNLSDNCDEVNNATVDGAFASYYSQVAQWLDPSGCVPTAEDCGNGIDDDCDGLVDLDDPDCPICVPTTEDCGNGIDDDCDGLVDLDDSDCCLPRGYSCTANDQCCSGSCHPRKLTCK